MKKISSLLLAAILAVLFCITPFAATGDLVFSCSDNGDGTVTVTGILKYTNSSIKDITIPSEIDGKTVTAIGSSAFSSKVGINVVRISATVQSIGAYAFNGCSNLSTVVFGDNVKTVGDFAFNLCTALTGVNLKNVESLGSYSFYGCKNLTSVTCGNFLKTIGSRAFTKCKAIQRVTFSKVLEEIGDYAFSECAELEAVSFPSTLKTIGNSAFHNCAVLETVTFPETGDISIGMYAFENCTSLKSVTLTPAVTEIGRYAFALREPEETEFSHDIEIISTGSPAAPVYGAVYGVTVKINGKKVSGYGDMDGNGSVTVDDARVLLRVVSKNEPPYTGDRLQFADMNLNGFIDLEDVVIILDIAAGIR